MLARMRRVVIGKGYEHRLVKSAQRLLDPYVFLDARIIGPSGNQGGEDRGPDL